MRNSLEVQARKQRALESRVLHHHLKKPVPIVQLSSQLTPYPARMLRPSLSTLISNTYQQPALPPLIPAALPPVTYIPFEKSPPRPSRKKLSKRQRSKRLVQNELQRSQRIDDLRKAYLL